MKRGLGRGLAELISVKPNDEPLTRYSKLKISDIRTVAQPRESFDSENLKELADSIAQHGVLQPLLVRLCEGKFTLIAGERRLRAAKMAGLEEVPVIILEPKSELDAGVIQLVENLHREDLNPLEEAKGYKNLVETFNLSQDEVARLVGKSRAHIANTMRLLSLDPQVKELLVNRMISAGHAKVLVGISSVAQRSLAKRVIAENISVRRLEELVRNLSAMEKGLIITKKRRIKEDPQNEPLLEEISKILGLKVSLSNLKLIIHLNSYSDLGKITNIFKSSN